MKAEEIRGLADDELVSRIAELEEERFRLRFRSGTEALEEPLRLRSIRRDIACSGDRIDQRHYLFLFGNRH